MDVAERLLRDERASIRKEIDTRILPALQQKQSETEKLQEEMKALFSQAEKMEYALDRINRILNSVVNLNNAESSQAGHAEPNNSDTQLTVASIVKSIFEQNPGVGYYADSMTKEVQKIDPDAKKATVTAVMSRLKADGSITPTGKKVGNATVLMWPLPMPIEEARSQLVPFTTLIECPKGQEQQDVFELESVHSQN